MFYVKAGKEKIEITDENVFSDCPVCGKEKQVDIAEIDDLFGISIYCFECAEKVKKSRLKALKGGKE